MIQFLSQKQKEIVESGELISSSWINIVPPFDHGELEQFAEDLSIPIDFLTDSLDIDERSRFEREENATFILINTPILNDNAKDNEAIYITVPIGIILVDNKIITISIRENPIVEKFLNNWIKGFDLNDKKLFVLQILEQNVYMFLAFLKKLNLKRNLIEEELYNSSRNKELRQLLRIEKSLVYFVNSLSANELLMLKMKRIDLLKIMDKDLHKDLFEDIIIDNSQALEMANVYTNILSGTMEAYASIVSNNLNVVIQRLTLVTIILMVPTLIASYYGMNVDLPLIGDNPTEFYIIVLVSIFLSLGLAWFFRKKRLF